ncbi:MAG TPA: cupin domain-containing protein [Vicinamibacterales bacterium]|nr:cupin domain-containing protein [Vicinamibacterales bacterium]
MKIGTVAVCLVLAAAAVYAQRPGVPLKILERSDTSAAGREAVTAVAEFASTSETRFHTHPGEMVGYILEGRVVLEQQNRNAIVLEAGESFIIPAGVPHNNRNEENKPARMFVTYFVAKGKPLRENAAR